MYTIVVVVLEFETNNKYDILNVLGQPIYHMFEGANLKYMLVQFVPNPSTVSKLVRLTCLIIFLSYLLLLQRLWMFMHAESDCLQRQFCAPRHDLTMHITDNFNNVRSDCTSILLFI